MGGHRRWTFRVDPTLPLQHIRYRNEQRLDLALAAAELLEAAKAGSQQPHAEAY